MNPGNKNKDFVYEIRLISERCHIECWKNKNNFKKNYSLDILSADNKNKHLDYVTPVPSKHSLV